MIAPLPANERERLEALRGYDVLDTLPEQSYDDITRMDGFKRVVDTHGHVLGAQVLREVAEAVHLTLDAADRIVRCGGDEYVVILPDQGPVAAFAKIERVRKAIASTHYLRREGIGVRATASFGCATYPHDAHDKEGLLSAADDCLFRSKYRGKDCITTPHDAGPPGTKVVSG